MLVFFSFCFLTPFGWESGYSYKKSHENLLQGRKICHIRFLHMARADLFGFKSGKCPVMCERLFFPEISLSLMLSIALLLRHSNGCCDVCMCLMNDLTFPH